MPRDRDQLTPAESDDLEHLRRHRGQGSAGTGRDLLPPERGAPLHLELYSPAFDDGAPLPDRCALDGANLSPPLEWSGVPGDAAELALLCEDPDAPSGTFTHWVVHGLDPRLGALDEGAVPPSAVVGRNDFGESGWSGPRPPKGDGPHRYVFTLVASSEPLGLDDTATPDQVRQAAAPTQLALGELVGTYERRA